MHISDGCKLSLSSMLLSPELKLNKFVRELRSFIEVYTKGCPLYKLIFNTPSSENTAWLLCSILCPSKNSPWLNLHIRIICCSDDSSFSLSELDSSFFGFDSSFFEFDSSFSEFSAADIIDFKVVTTS